MTEENYSFQTEVSKLLDIVAHSLYTHREIFLRELISNASDACDRLRYLAITDPSLIAGESEFKIRLIVDPDARTLTVADNGIGMDHQELIDNLGTIARSGTQAFLTQMGGDANKDMALIGQFGVGFYSAFMVADRVEVITRKAGGEKAWRWGSDGKGRFTIDEAERPERGTSVILHMKSEESEFLEEHRIDYIVTKYSDHIGFPIVLGTGNDGEAINAASSLWTRPKGEISEQQYKEFYHHVGHTFDDPWHIMHNRVEGVVSYTSLLFIPTAAPLNLFHPDRRSQVKLYVKRVFITDDCEGLLPRYLRFLKGIVDSEDLPLNISRETFQHDPRLAKMKTGLVRRVLDELAKKAGQDPEAYDKFWEIFGAVLKEGMYEDLDHRERLLGLCRFRSTAADGFISLDTYVSRMQEGQEAIYVIHGAEAATLKRSPQLEGFQAKGIEVLLFTDPIDEFWVPIVRSYQDKPFKSAAEAGADLDKIGGADGAAASAAAPEEATAIDRLASQLKGALGDLVREVRPSQRLTESAVCLVAAEGDMDMHLERMLRQHRQLDPSLATPRILEINPRHPLIRRLAARVAEMPEEAAELADAAHLLLDQARILEGETLRDPVAFSRRLSAVMERGLVPAAIAGGS
jgi:molecular chaperone HtpG